MNLLKRASLLALATILDQVDNTIKGCFECRTLFTFGKGFLFSISKKKKISVDTCRLPLICFQT